MWSWARIDTGLSTQKLIEILNQKLKALEGERAFRSPAYFDARDYGIGQSVGDNSKGLQDAYDDVALRGGGKLVFPPFTDSLDFSSEVAGRKRTHLQGSGMGNTILNYTGLGRGIVYDGGAPLADEAWRTSIADLSLQSNGAVYPYLATYGLVLNDMSLSSTRRVEITGWGTAALLLSGVRDCLSHSFWEVDIHENNNGVRTAGGNVIINHINFGPGCRIRASQQWNIYNDRDVRNWKMVGVDLEAGVIGAVYMNMFYGLTIDTCYFEQINGAPVAVLGDTQTGAGLKMFGNHIAGLGPAAGGTAVKLGVGGGSVAGSVTENWFGGWLVGINKAGLFAGGDYTTGNKYDSVTTPTV